MKPGPGAYSPEKVMRHSTIAGGTPFRNILVGICGALLGNPYVISDKNVIFLNYPTYAYLF